MPLNSSQQLPAPYKQLIDGIKQNLLQEWLDNWQYDQRYTIV